MYMSGAYDCKQIDSGSLLMNNRFRDSSARKNSYSPNRSSALAEPGTDQLNSSSCRDAIYLSHGILDLQSSPQQQPLSNTVKMP